MNIQPVSYLTGTSSTSAQGSRHQTLAASHGNTSSTSSSNSLSYDKRDLNQDGYVSSLEELLYALSHPGESSSIEVLAQYNPQGDLSIKTSAMPRLVDITV